MKNIKYEVRGNVLVIEVNLDQDYGLSKSGKSIIVASSEGFIQVPEANIAIGLNVTKPK